LLDFIKKHKWLLAALVLWLVMHAPHMSKDLVGRHVWRQAQTQGTIENFVTEDFNILNPREHRRNVYEGYYRMEFPLYQWLIAGAGKLIGSTVSLSRWLTLFISLLSILGMFKLLNRFTDDNTAQMGAWAFAWSPSLFYFGINPLPDNLALCLGIWGLAMFFKFFESKTKFTHLLLSAILLALAAAIKLPFGLFYAVPFYFAILALTKWNIKTFIKNLVYIPFLVLPIAWYAWVIPTWDKIGILSGGGNEELQKLWYYFVRNLWGIFPELILNFGSVFFFLVGIWIILKFKLYKHSKGQSFILLFIALAAYFFYVLKMIQGNHEYYLFVFYPIVFAIVTLGIKHLIQKSLNLKRISLALLMLLPIFTYLRSSNSWDTENPSVPKELLDKKEWFQNLTPKEDLCIVGSDQSPYTYFYYLDKRGYAFSNDSIPPEKLALWIKSGAKYLYSDSRKFEAAKYVHPYLGSLIAEEGNFKVFRLKSP